MTAPGELTDQQWHAVRELLPPASTGRGRPWREHRAVLNGILWVQRNQASWRSMPFRYGPWITAYSRWRRWRADGTWDAVLDCLRETAPEVLP